MKRTAPLLLLTGVLFLTMLACQISPAARNSPLLPSTPTSPVQPNGSNPEPSASGQQSELTALYDRVNGGVVSIQVITDQGGGQGSGFVFDQQGHIVTNLHVVDGATQIEVDFPSGVKVYGKTIGTDSDSDIAVLKVDVPASQLTVLPLGSGAALRVGQTVVAIGNPFGLNGTMTLGIVSAKDRTMDSLHETASGGYFSSGAVIQTDAAIDALVERRQFGLLTRRGGFIGNAIRLGDLDGGGYEGRGGRGRGAQPAGQHRKEHHTGKKQQRR